ncbi:hypothetical protein CEE37_00470 [candidate division LCP-89 bacterium B3_LCP]|uniref:Secretion system C-terminal sorting domain-containing protein n=1 Tax=candidate division LCP-89 bacterium B3_LCP TaxID=2012998 RepID=A0A532V4R5_UNCL8|nr:MAG: hypothetical protein CEE37_00470 [candidate division LCP-89 bacterium B3_LCP]
MRILIGVSLILCFIVIPASGQESWILLEEYTSPGNYAMGLYYAGKYLWHVDWDTSSNDATIYKLNPYNMAVIDSIPSPIEHPWGITADANSFWLTTHGDWGGSPVSTLAKIRTDTFMVSAIYSFPDFYFYGITCDSTTNHLWIACQTSSWDHYLMEFNPDSGEVVEWHPWESEWDIGIQYWGGELWVNTTDYFYPDYTYVADIDSSLAITNTLRVPYANPCGIATNGVIWWIAYYRFDNFIICKLIPPGTTYHDIAAHSPVIPQSGILEIASFEPQFRFINYGSVPEIDVPFVCEIENDSTGAVIYHGEDIYGDEIAPEEIVTITYPTVSGLLLEPETDYTFTFYSDLLTDQIRDNDTMRVHVCTEGVHDLAILSVIDPDTTEPQATIIPSISVQNQGSHFEPVAPVHLQIEHPDGSLSDFDSQVLDLDPLEIDTIYFSPFDPTESGEYVFEFDGMLPDDYNPENDYMMMMCAIGLVHDVAPAEVVSPEAFEPLQPITPRVIVENLGDYDEPLFPVSCTVEDSVSTVYSEQGYCQPLEPGEQWEVVFYNFYPQYPTNYIFNFTTLLTGDQVPENDTLSITSAVGLIYDVAPIDVIEPTQIIGPEPFTPSVMVKNEGNVFADGFFIHCQVDSESVSLYNMQTWLPALNPNETDTAFFDMITLSNLGEYRFLFISDWQLDNYPENDTLEFWPEYLSVIDGKDALHISDFHVEGAFPNPFNSQTVFEISLPEVASIDVSLFDLSGCCVHQMNFDPLTPGVHRIELKVSNLPSGMYIARVSTEKWEESIKVVLLK